MYSYTTQSSGDGSVFAVLFGSLLVFTLIGLVLYVLTALGLGQFFKKAGKPAWAAFVPFYNYWIMTEISGVEQYWFWLILGAILGFIPVIGWLLSIASVVAVIFITMKFLRKYGKDTGHVVLAVIFPYVYYPVVGYSKDLHYAGTVTVPKAKDTTPPSAPTPVA